MLFSEIIYKKRNNGASQAKVAVLYICTGKYVVFWKQFYCSYRKRVLRNSETDFYVFTDAADIYAEEDNHVHKIEQKQLGWPYDTMMRFQMFLRVEDELRQFDYLFFFNANCYCKRKITEEEFLPQKEGLLFTRHPGMYNKGPMDLTFDRNPESTAYIPEGEGSIYVAGGLNGGKTGEYLAMIHELKNRTEQDIQKKVIARYHDESQINRYLLDMMKTGKQFKLLSPAYCYPEGWKIPFQDKIIILDKSKYFNDRALKGQE